MDVSTMPDQAAMEAEKEARAGGSMLLQPPARNMPDSGR
jgi:hypothetical protein